MVKNYVRSNNTTYKLEDVQRLLIEGINRISAENWERFVHHTTSVAQKFTEMGHIIDEMTDANLPDNPAPQNSDESDTD